MNADSAFFIGKTHDVCQDYAKTGRISVEGKLSDRPFAIVSDGCSSSPDTDFGARILTVVANECLNNFGCLKDEWIIWRASEKMTLPISPNCLDATLLCCYDDGEFIKVNCAGDGAIVIKFQDGHIWYCEIDYNGAPGYLSYLLKPENKKKYVETFGGIRTVKLYIDGVQQKYVTTSCVETDPFFEKFSFKKSDVDYVMVASDGINSFTASTDAGPVPVSPIDVVAKLADIKSLHGEFIARRLKFFLKKECPALGWNHSDDLSIAAIAVE